MRSGLGTFSDRRYSSSTLSISAQNLYLKHRRRDALLMKDCLVVVGAAHEAAFVAQARRHVAKTVTVHRDIHNIAYSTGSL
jgi:hypothetical protein